MSAPVLQIMHDNIGCKDNSQVRSRTLVDKVISKQCDICKWDTAELINWLLWNGNNLISRVVTWSSFTIHISIKTYATIVYVRKSI